MRFFRKILCVLLFVPLWLLSLLPLRIHYFFSDVLYLLLYRLVKYRRKVVESNVKMAFPESSDEENAKVVKEFYRYLSDVICEIVWGISSSPEHIKRRGVFSVENGQILSEAFRKYGNVVVLLAHTGNWELFSGLPKFMDNAPFDYSNLTVAYHALSSHISEDLFKMIRQQTLKDPCNLVTTDRMLRFILEHRNDRRVYFFISDQYPWINAAVKTDFLGLKTVWVNGGEAVARKLNMPVVYIYIDRPCRGKHIIKVEMLCENPAGTEPGEIMTAYSERLQRDIRANKPNWLWSHRRWKNLDN